MGILIDLKADRSEIISYDFPDYFAYIRKGVLSHYPNYAALSHWHDDIELIYVLSGEMDYNINGEIVTLQEQEGLFVNARQLHYGFSAQKKECIFLCVILHPILLCQSPQIEQNYITPVLTNQAFPYKLLHHEIAWENHIIELIKELFFQPEKQAPQLQIQSVFYQIWLELFHNAPKLPKSRSYQKNLQLTCLKDMMSYMQAHYKEKLSLQDIALVGNISKSKCCSLFRQYLHQTPIDYLIKYRLQKSIELMTSTEMNITEISFESGFSGTSYYIETFHKHFGCSPLEYRTKYLK